MELNIEILVIVAVIAILILFFTTRKNLKEKRILEDKIKKTELGTDHHKEDKRG